MKHLLFSFDVVSPYAYLAFERLPRVLKGLSYEVSYQPVLLAGLLTHWGQKGPAEIVPKREWTYRQVSWLAQHHQVPLQMPALHPFNPLPLLRLALATSPAGMTPNRWACEQVLHHVWRSGEDASDAARLAELTQRLAPRRDPQSGEIKEAVKSATADAASRGVFGVPTVEVDGKLFWGLDGLDLLASYLHGEDWFKGTAWDDATQVPVGVQRKP
jgi:2-hydroxychromene-2-carboxylate isomerase